MQPVDNKAVGSRLETIILRSQAKSRRAFALSVGADPSFFDKIVKGSAPLTQKIASDIANKYGVNEEWIWTGGGEAFAGNSGEGRRNEHKLDEAIRREREAVDRERASWERERKTLQEDKAFLQDLIRANLTLVQATLKTIRFRQEANGEIGLAALARLEAKPEGALIEAADKRISQIEAENAEHDIASAPGRSSMGIS